MAQTTDQLLQWITAELPVLKCRLARTHAAIEHARNILLGEPASPAPANDRERVD
jgi:hypothetical protein